MEGEGLPESKDHKRSDKRLSHRHRSRSRSRDRKSSSRSHHKSKREHRSRSRSPSRSSKHRHHRKHSRHHDRDRRSKRENKDDIKQVESYGEDLNKLQAKIMKARLTNSSDLPELERQLAQATSQGSPSNHTSDSQKHGKRKDGNIIVLPQIDSRGRKVNISASSMDQKGKHEKRASKRNSSRNDGGDDITIAEMARKERETEGDDYIDRELAAQISKDARFSNDLEYIDENIERLAKEKNEKTEAQKKQAAINDYRAMDALLNNCDMCFKQNEQDDGSSILKPPDYPIIALGNRVYLALPNREPMNDGHCLISPIEHVPGSSLNCDEDTWDEIHNFMKCLIQMFARRNQGVVFIETVMSVVPSKARHCMVECIPMPIDKASDAPGYFKQGLLMSDEEWSQHRKVIDTMVKEAPSKDAMSQDPHDQDNNHSEARRIIRSGGFRNVMTSKMPYFHVWFHPHGGMGHVIENPSQFPPWFGREVIAGMLDLPPTVYRRPRKLKESHNQRRDRAEEWKRQFGWAKFDWTRLLSE